MRQCATEYHNSRAMPDFTLDVSVDGADDVVTTSSGAHAHVSDNASSVVQLTRDTLREACELVESRPRSPHLLRDCRGREVAPWGR